jgi:CBS domain-containing protein
VRPDEVGSARRAPRRIGLLVARTSRILNARSLDELVGETADAARRVLRAERAVALIQTDGVTRCCAKSPRWEVPDAIEPTWAVPLVARDGRCLGTVQVWARSGSTLTREDEQVIAQLAHCASTVADRALARTTADGDLFAQIGRLMHDVRTPLAAVLSWTWALKRGLDATRATQAVEAIERNALAQARLLDRAAETLREVPRSSRIAEPTPGDEVARPSLAHSPGPSKEGGLMGRHLRDVMSTGVETVAPGDTIRLAAEKMDALDIGSLPVCDGERLMGVVTDRDIAVRAVAAGRDPNRTAVVETMTHSLVFGFADQPLDEAVELMREHEIRRLPVVDEQRRLVGIVALADLALRGDPPAATDALEGVSKPRAALD